MAPAPAVTRPASISAEDREFIERLLDRITAAYGRFKFELWTYNALCLVAAILAVYSAVTTALVDPKAVGGYLVSGGLFGITGYRITHFLTGDLRTMNTIIDRILAGGRNNG